jgi:hypothetical protein
MFKPLVVTQPPHIYHVNTEMEIGTFVKYEIVGGAATGDLIPAADGKNVLGATAQKVMSWANRPREYDLFPELFLGFTFDPTFINLPGFAAGGKVGIWYEKGAEFETEIYAADGVTVMPAGVAINTKLVVAPTGKLTPDVADGRDIVATVKGPGTGVGLKLNDVLTSYTIVLTSNMAN